MSKASGSPWWLAAWRAIRRYLRRIPWPAILVKVLWAGVIWFIDHHHGEWW